MGHHLIQDHDTQVVLPYGQLMCQVTCVHKRSIRSKRRHSDKTVEGVVPPVKVHPYGRLSTQGHEQLVHTVCSDLKIAVRGGDVGPKGFAGHPRIVGQWKAIIGQTAMEKA